MHRPCLAVPSSSLRRRDGPAVPGRAALALLLSVSTPPVATPSPGTPAVRVLDERLASALGSAAGRSATLRRALRHIETSDLIVHVVAASEREARWYIGLMRLVGASPTRRYLRVAVNSPLSPNDLAEALGHELHHAVEVAGAPGVRDAHAFAAFYARHGHRTGIAPGTGGFDTAGAARGAPGPP